MNITALFAFLICTIPIVVQAANNVSRKDEILLESAINDFIHRNQVRRSFPFAHTFEAYGSVVNRSIIVYVYFRIPLNPKNVQERENIVERVKGDFPELENYIKRYIKDTILDFEDFAWARFYGFSVILRLTQ